MLTSRDRLILIFEETHPAGGGKEEAIREAFGFSAVRYFQILNGLLGSQDAEAEFPMLIHRLRRLAVERDRSRRRAG